MIRIILIAMSLATMSLIDCPVIACIGMPQSLTRPHAEVVAEAKLIFLAEVVDVKSTSKVSAAKKPVRYRLKVIRVLKGKVGLTVKLDGEGDLSGIWDTTFSDHTDNEFWNKYSGRMGILGDCAMVLPHFLLGKQYLVLISPAEDTKQFERVDIKYDRWLQYVIAHVQVY